MDIAYKKQKNPKIAVEVLIGHGHAFVTIEASVKITREEVKQVVWRLAEIENVKLVFVYQDKHLANNQAGKFRCGDNGIFKGVPITGEQTALVRLAKNIYEHYPYDGKYIIDNAKKQIVICQSNAITENLKIIYKGGGYKHLINPLGDWTGGTDVDSGATNRKLGSDMGDSVTGGGLHGKDLSKADVSINIYAFLKAQETHAPVEISCAIGDEFVDDKPYGQIVAIAREFIDSLGGFEKFAEWGLLNPNWIFSH